MKQFYSGFGLLVFAAFCAAACGDVHSDLITGPPGAMPRCSGDSDCAAGETCAQPSATCVKACTNNLECPASTPVCETVTRLCVPCASDVDCQGRTASRCDTRSGVCVECLEDDHCSNRGDRILCEKGRGRCVECLANNFCEEANETCSLVIGECAIPCSAEKSCPPGDARICDPTINFCVECLDDEDCGGRPCRSFECAP